ncbi:MAG: CHAT domain-containing protein, partial [Bacteroidota bacterium]
MILGIILLFFFCNFSVKAQDEGSLISAYQRAVQSKDFTASLKAASGLQDLYASMSANTPLEHGRSWFFMAYSLRELKDYDSSLVCYDRCRAILEQRDLIADTLYTQVLFEQGLTHYLNENLRKAVEEWESYRRALVKRIGKETKGYYSVTRNLGGLKFMLGLYQEAEVDNKEAYDLVLVKWGKKSREYAQLALNYGALKYQMGDWLGSERLWLDTKAFYETNPQVDSLDIMCKVNKNLGNVYRDMNDFIRAESFYQQALKYALIQYDSTDKEIALLHNNLGRLYFLLGLFPLADSMYSLALVNLTQKGKENAEYAMVLFNFGLLAEKQEQYVRAEQMYEEVLKIREKILGRDHPFYREAETQLAGLYLLTNRIELGYKNLTRILAEKSKEVSDNFEWLDESQQESYWRTEFEFYDKIIWSAQMCHNTYPPLAGLAYNISLQTKSRLLESKVSSEDFYQEIEELRDSLKFYRRRLAKMESEGLEDLPLMAFSREQANRFDKELQLRNDAYAKQKANLQITWQQVQRELDSGEVAIEFLRILNVFDSTVYYHALLLKRNLTDPIWIRLCSENEIKDLQPEFSYAQYYNFLWKPLEPFLKGIKNVYYAPVGELSKVPFHALYDLPNKLLNFGTENKVTRGRLIKSRYLINNYSVDYLMDRYSMHQLTSTRYLAIDLKARSKRLIDNRIALFGGVNYNFLPKSVLLKATEDPDEEQLMKLEGALPFLEGSKSEVFQANNLLHSKGWKTEFFYGDSATEESIKAIDGGNAPSILHLSTHGYAFSNDPLQAQQIPHNSLKYTYRNHKNPLVRSGLILSGGNWAWLGNDVLSSTGEFENGVLTALEVSQLKLRKTKLVVLSACQSGLGSVQG